VNAGTVEFVVSGERPDDAYFLEMNTRLQVEHPVTELVWGIDIVEQQLRIAAGEPLGFTQSDLAPHGHAFEARVYAEDPATGFLPTGGTVELLEEPVGHHHVRLDSSLRTGTVVGSDYDPMLAKVIAWGPHRDDARRRLDTALAHTTVLGLVTNIAFLRELLRNPGVIAGEMDTSLIDRLTSARPAPATPPTVTVAAALALLGASAGPGPWDDRRGWRLGEPATIVMRLVDGAGDAVEVRLRDCGDRTWEASVGEQAWRVIAARAGSHLRLSVEGVIEDYAVAVTASGAWLGREGSVWRYAPAPAHGPGRNATAEAGLTVVSPMPGTVVSIDVAIGDHVEPGHAIAVVEAMKMEHTLRASRAAVVREVAAAVGDRVGLHQTLVVLEATEA
jgi:acetyl-CoA/propionyl-CoA carboxylase biotin carboxyl carrier protein